MLLPPLPDRNGALFLDFDGTLAELALRPEQVRLDAATQAAVGALWQALDGALAIVTGRAIDTIDRHLAPLRLPMAGVHGAERRSADGVVHRMPAPDLTAARALIDAAVAAHPGLWCEVKPGALALHFRAAPALEEQCLRVMERAQRAADGMSLLRGKMVIEMKPQRAGKGHALLAFLHEAPFVGRRPWVFGDDVTDEAAFDVALGLGGVAVKVGAGESAAPYRIDSPAALEGWMRDALAAMHGGAR